MKVDSVITLDNDVSCLLLEKVTYQNDNYFLAIVLNNNNEPTDEYVVFKEIIEDDIKYVEKITNDETLQELVKLFTQSVNRRVDELLVEG